MRRSARQPKHPPRTPRGGAGAEERFTRVWRHYYPRLVVFVRARREYPQEEVEDAVQEIMMKVFRNLDRYRTEYALGTWIYAIARNHCRDMARALARHPRAQPYDDEEGPSSTPLRSEPEAQLLREHTRRAVQHAMDSLAPGLRQVAFLRFHEGMKLRDIAQALDTPLGTIKYQVHEVKNRVRAGLVEAGHAG